jgi:cation diffusion facilitator CzcD-associated flavoprotein CzcO
MSAKSTIETNTLVIGAGAAGLAVGACLQRAGAPFIILERDQQVGSAWRGHYDRLHLHTDRANSALPYRRFPRTVARYPSRQQVIQYLEGYAKEFDLRPRFGQQVRSARREDDRWLAETQDSTYAAQNLVVASGYASEPLAPQWPGMETFRGEILHSAQYGNGAPYSGRRVLVVGFGNSGGEIALDLCEHSAQVSLSVRGAVNVVPRDLLGLPILALAIPLARLPNWLADALSAPLLKATIGDFTRYGLRKLPYGPIPQIKRDGRIPLLDVGAMQRIKQGEIKVRPGVERFLPGGVIFSDGVGEAFDAVVLATGYRPALGRFLELPAGVLDDNAVPTASGAESAPGLFFCGFYVSPTGMLREIGIEARRIAKSIQQRSGSL